MPPPARLLLLPLALIVQLVGSELVLVYSIHRHGARSVLAKSSVGARA